MDKAILRTLIYADIFDYPMLPGEIHKWLIEKEASIEQVEKALKKLKKAERSSSSSRKIVEKNGMFFLWKRQQLVQKRLAKEIVSQNFYQKALWVSRVLKVVPWIRLIGISGSLAMRNADQDSDIDLFIITRPKRVWLSRLASSLLLDLWGVRRHREDNDQNSAGKICLNLFISENDLEQKQQDLYIAHEVLQMKVLWERKNCYRRFLEANNWAKQFLPNWIGISGVERKVEEGMEINKDTVASAMVDGVEKLVEWLQRRYMGRLSGDETVSDNALYFHPQDQSRWVMREYTKRVKRYMVTKPVSKYGNDKQP